MIPLMVFLLGPSVAGPRRAEEEGVSSYAGRSSSGNDSDSESTSSRRTADDIEAVSA